MIFYHMLPYTSLKRASKQNYIYTLNSDDSSNINKVIKRISNLFIFLWRDSYIQKYEEKST